MSIRFKHIMIYSCILFSSISCKKSNIDRLDLEEQLEIKYKDFITTRVDACKQRAVTEAELAIDSIIDQLLSKDLIDTINFPAKPVRPEKSFEDL